MKRMLLVIGAALAVAGCSSHCINAGVTVDDKGNIVVRTDPDDVQFVSPNSRVLAGVRHWPALDAQASPAYTLSADGRWLYVSNATDEKPNRVERIDLKTGRTVAAVVSADETSQETWIADADAFVYSVSQNAPSISRFDLKLSKFKTYIAGSRTRLSAPTGIARGSDGLLCVADGGVYCYSPGARGNVAPLLVLDKATIGFAQIDAIALSRGGILAVAANSQANGLGDNGIALFALKKGAVPKRLGVLRGGQTGLAFTDALAFSREGDVLALSDGRVLSFSSTQRGNVAPQWSVPMDPSLGHAFRMAVDQKSDDVALLASSGVQWFARAAHVRGSTWHHPSFLAVRGSDIALDAGNVIVANAAGKPVSVNARALADKRTSTTAWPELGAPDFFGRDQNGRMFSVSTVGVITRLPKTLGESSEAIAFQSPFDREVQGFAADSAGYFYITSAMSNSIIVVTRTDQWEINGPKTGLASPEGLAVARDGTLYVANHARREILEFARGARGDIAPIARIAGDATTLAAPGGLGLDASGSLDVFDGPGDAMGSPVKHFVRVFDSAHGGNVAPLRVFEVQTSCAVDAL